MTNSSLSLPPLLRGIEAGRAPWHRAQRDAERGETTPGDVYWSPYAETLQTAVVFEPDRPLSEAMLAVFAVACGLHDCIGALAPPETAVHHQWPDTLLVNNAVCGVIRVAVSNEMLQQDIPHWMIVAVDVALAPVAGDPGDNPNVTSLAEEGYPVEDVQTLIESWARHMLVWIHRWEQDGPRPLHDAWLSRARGRGEDTAVRCAGAVERGEFLGIAEHGDMLIKTESGVRQLSLTSILDHPASWPPEALL